MITPNIVEQYESLSVLTNQMRVAAEQGEWDRLVALEQQCSCHVATMKSVDTEIKLDEPARQHKIQLIKKILSDDAEIRNHTVMWTKQLQRIMQSNRKEQSLHQLYGV